MLSLLFVVLLSSIAATPAVAFQSPLVGTEVSVRVPHPFEGSERHLGVIEGVSGDRIHVRVRDRLLDLDTATARPQIQLDGRKHEVGGAIGLAIGLVVGGLYAYSTYEPDYQAVRRCTQRPGAMMGSLYGATCRTVGREDAGSRGGRILGGASLGALGGGLVGLLVGSAVREWAPLDLSRVQVSPDGIAVSIER